MKISFGRRATAARAYCLFFSLVPDWIDKFLKPTDVRKEKEFSSAEGRIMAGDDGQSNKKRALDRLLGFSREQRSVVIDVLKREKREPEWNT